VTGRKDLFMTALIDRAQAAQDRIEARVRHLPERRRPWSEDYIEGLIIGGSLGSLLGVVTALIFLGAL
jgi:hypothetical protein